MPAGLEVSPAHTGRMYGRQGMPSATGAEASQNSQLSNEQPYYPAPHAWGPQSGMPMPQGLQTPIYYMPYQVAKDWPHKEPVAEAEPAKERTKSPKAVENPESAKATDAKPHGRQGKAIMRKRERPTPSPNTAEQNEAA